jgi:sugar phosphate isomerase/epimerase
MIYASTNCLKHPKNLEKVLTEYQKGEIKNVELGSVHEYFDTKILKKFDFNFVIHNYFPPPKIPFNFNLASKNKIIRQKSLKLAKKAIDLCCNIQSPLYTFHAGFTVDPPELGKPFPKINYLDKKDAIDIYIDEVSKIIDYANSNGIKVAIEPNVVQEFNLIKGKNELCLFADFSEIKYFFDLLKNSSLGLLLDLGHTSVTSHWLNFDKDNFVEKCKDRVFAIHISNNNGLQDQHKALTNDCWQVSKLKKFKNLPIVLETMNLSIEQIKENIQLVKNSIM